ncbi:50S ribosomal protein L1 [Candidatus Saccharibacteria bacterium]|nr:50S ribosomal protein L1 [Candidatus Saccharibacteria bacterium]
MEAYLKRKAAQTKPKVAKKTSAPTVEKESTATAADAKLAKAGKRSSKTTKEVAEKEAKEVRKTQIKKAKKDEVVKPKQKQKPHVKKYSKNQEAGRALIESDKKYGLKDAIDLLYKVSKVKFDASAELHVALNIDPRQADQMVRANTSLPFGTGKPIRVAVITTDELVASAKQAGADIVDADSIIKDIMNEKFDFDVLIVSPDRMAEVGKLAKALGPKGLMPSPKNGTVTADPAKSVDEFKKGKVEIKNDANGIVHLAFGKLSFKPEALYGNAKAAIKALSSAKPSGVKGVFIRSMYVSASMSPSIQLDNNEAVKEAREVKKSISTSAPQAAKVAKEPQSKSAQ